MDDRRFRLYVSIIAGLFMFNIVRVVANVNPIYEFGEPVFAWLNEFASDVAISRDAEGTATELSAGRNDILSKQNVELRSELELKTSRNTVAAEVTRRDLLGFKKLVWVNIGKDSGVKPGQTVLHQGSLFGIVDEVFGQSATVQTVLDPDFRATVAIDGERGVLKVEYGSLEVGLVPSKTKTKSAVETDGLDGRVVSGIYVGVTDDATISTEADVFGAYNVIVPFNVYSVNFVDIINSEQN